jgi:hypothetical protein
MTVDVPEALLELMREKAQTTPGIIALLLVGSAARGYMEPNSDWDFVGVVEDEEKWSKPYRDGGRETFAGPDGRQVEVAFSSLSRLRRRIAEQSREGTNWTAEYLTEGLVIWPDAPDDRLRQLQAEARAILDGGPDAITQDDLAWRCYEIWNRVKDLEDAVADPVTGHYISLLAYWNLVTLYFRLAKEWLPRPKAMSPTVEALDPNLHKLCSEFAVASSNRAHHRVLRGMMELIEGCFGIVFESYYTSPPVDAPP